MLDAGLSPSGVKRRVAQGLWAVVLPGVDRSPTVAPTIKQGAMAACLWAGPDALVSHRAAAVLWELDGVTATRMEITVPTRSRVRSPKLIVHRTGDLIPADRAQLDGIALTSPLRTLIDLAAALDDEHVELAIEDAFRRALASPKQLAWRLAALDGKGRRGCDRLRGLLARRSATTGSGWEVRAARLLVRAGVPEPVRQYEIRDGGRLVARVDLAYPGQRVAIEFDSVRWHTGRARIDHEADRRARLAALGWRVVPITATALEESPAEVVANVAAALAQEVGPDAR